jgi:hypothetical protein
VDSRQKKPSDASHSVFDYWEYYNGQERNETDDGEMSQFTNVPMSQQFTAHCLLPLALFLRVLRFHLDARVQARRLDAERD